MGGFGEWLILLVDEGVAKMAEGFLLGDYRDVILAGVGNEFAGVGGGDAAAGGRGERV